MLFRSLLNQNNCSHKAKSVSIPSEVGAQTQLSCFQVELKIPGTTCQGTKRLFHLVLVWISSTKTGRSALWCMKKQHHFWLRLYASDCQRPSSICLHLWLHTWPLRNVQQGRYEGSLEINLEPCPNVGNKFEFPWKVPSSWESFGR